MSVKEVPSPDGAGAADPRHQPPAAQTVAHGPGVVGPARQANRRRALGIQPDGPVSGGMERAQLVDFPVGTLPCRLGHRGTPIQLSLSSAWWITEADVLALVRRAASARDGLALSHDDVRADTVVDAIRAGFDLDLLASLGNSADRRPCDRVCTVEVIRPLRAFRGPGRPVADRARAGAASPRVWRADPGITQLDIPGLGTGRGRMSATARTGPRFRRALAVSHWRARVSGRAAG